MRGLMMDRPLTIASIIEYAASYHGEREIVTRTVEGPIHRYTYGDACLRARKLSQALRRLGVRPGDRVATMAWNTHRHFEVYYGVSGMGAVCHTINPRLFPDQIAYIVDHAADAYLCFDLSFADLVESLAPRLPSVRGYVVLTDEAHMPATKLPGAVAYESLVAAEDGDYRWPDLDEWTASSLCYTSGTTGHPKGVMYTHRSTVLHTMALCMSDNLGFRSRDVVMPVVPMFHANAWGLVYAAPAAGAKLVLPGRDLDGASVHELLDAEAVTFTAGVPTVWLGLLQHLRAHGGNLRHLERLLGGGSAMPLSMIREIEEDHGVSVLHAWGMTEISPVGSTGQLKASDEAAPAEIRYGRKVTQGRGIFGVEMKIVDADGAELPRDGVAFGDLLVRGPFVCSGYYRGEGGDVLDADGWFRTGDVATIDRDGYMRIVDRSKDVIKSGGEWISSIEIENLAVSHPDVAEACVIAVPHPKWTERPLLLVVRRAGSALDRPAMLAFLRDRVARWWLPDDVVFVDELPHTATGKLMKSALRETYRDHPLPTGD
jgi:acyl-CoA synthetase (AMP-forming)/AMP-acid ligase II